MMKKCYIFLFLLAVVSCGMLYLFYSRTNNVDNYKCKNCNVIVISLNFLRKDHLPCFGYFRNTARDICKLAKKSILFENFINQSYLTSTSQMSIFTSMYPSNLNYLFVHSDVEKKVDTFPEILKKNNYYTAAFGSEPKLMPNQANKGYTYVEDANKLQFSNGFDLYEFARHFGNPYSSLEWLKGSRGKSKFFLWLPIASLHWPHALWGPREKKEHFVNPNYSGVFKEYEFIPGEVVLNIYNDIYYFNLDKPESIKLDDMDKEFIISKYDYDIIYLNYYIRKLINTLKEENLLDNTLIVIHGSHGVDLSEHSHFSNYDIYDTEVNTMMMIYNPVLKNRHIRIKNQIRGLDFLPTVLDILDIPVPENALGISLNKYLPDNVPDDLVAFTERVPPLEVQLIKSNKYVPGPWLKKFKDVFKNKKIWADTSIRTNKWKLIHRRFKEFEEKISWWKLLSGDDFRRREYELYNVIEDPMNLKNVIDLHPKVFKKLVKTLNKWERENTYAFFVEP